MAGVTLKPDTPYTRKTLQDAARHEFILKMYAEIAMDMNICELEGWDKMEFIEMLYDVLSHFKNVRESSRKDGGSQKDAKVEE